MKRFIAVSLLLLLLSVALVSQEPVISPEELERALVLITISSGSIDGSIEHATELKKSNETLIESSQNSADTLENSKNITDNSAKTLTYLSTTTDETEQNSENLENISTDLNLISKQQEEVSQNLKPFFWESPLGRGSLFLGGVVTGILICKAADWIGNK